MIHHTNTDWGVVGSVSNQQGLFSAFNPCQKTYHFSFYRSKYLLFFWKWISKRYFGILLIGVLYPPLLFFNIFYFVSFRMEISTIRSSKRGSGRETPSTTTTWPRPCSRSSSSQPLKDGRGKKQSFVKRQIPSFNFVIHAFSKTDVNKVSWFDSVIRFSDDEHTWCKNRHSFQHLELVFGTNAIC